jgi:hypothetical protein
MWAVGSGGDDRNAMPMQVRGGWRSGRLELVRGGREWARAGRARKRGESGSGRGSRRRRLATPDVPARQSAGRVTRPRQAGHRRRSAQPSRRCRSARRRLLPPAKARGRTERAGARGGAVSSSRQPSSARAPSRGSGYRLEATARAENSSSVTRALHPHPARRLGLRRHLPLLGRARGRPLRLARLLQSPPTTRLPRPPNAAATPQGAAVREQPDRVLQLGHVASGRLAGIARFGCLAVTQGDQE